MQLKTSAFAIVPFVMTSLMCATGGCAFKSAADQGRMALTPPQADIVRWPDVSGVMDLQVSSNGWAEFLELETGGRGRLYELVLDREKLDEQGRGTATLQFAEPWEMLMLAQLSRGVSKDSVDGFRTLYFTSAQPPENPQELIGPTMLHVAPPASEPGRGTVLMMASIVGSTDGDGQLAEMMHDNGWFVIWASPPLSGLPDKAPPLDRLSDMLDRHQAQSALAVAAAWKQVQREYEWADERPLVAIGSSAGAIGLPTMVAGLDRPVDAAVLVGGGADVFRIVGTSPLFAKKCEVTIDGRRPSKEELESMRAEVLQSVSLDPYHTASYLNGTPVLMIHAMFDAIVPAKSGDLLYERLGKPERWSYPVGHLGLFATMPMFVPEIYDWIENAVADRPSVASVPTSGSGP